MQMLRLTVMLSPTSVDSETDCPAAEVLAKLPYWLEKEDIHLILIQKTPPEPEPFKLRTPA